MVQPAILALADGTLFRGAGIGAAGSSAGEVVFNTAMTGYQEILTDPSYSGQITTLTHPHIGNTGCNSVDEESESVHAAGLVIRDLPSRYSSWRGTQTLGAYLREHGIVGIAEIDTRHLTRLLRSGGVQNGCIMSGDIDDEAAVAAARACPSLVGADLAQVVTTTAPYEWQAGTWIPESDDHQQATGEALFHVVAVDFGIKRNILRMLVDRGCRVTVVPARSSAAEIMALAPDGVFLSNGPGDPQPCDYAIEAIQALLKAQVPLFGICLGYQLLAIASGAKTEKMKFGHHGANHPVIDLNTGGVMISSQNHGFAVDRSSLQSSLVATHESLFDHSLQGIRHRDCPAYGFQGHPEASPGPHDVESIFDPFIGMMRERRADA